MSEIIFIVLITNMMIIAFNLFAIESSKVFSLQTLVGVSLLICLLPVIFGYCFLAEVTTANLYGIGGIFYESPWYRLPVKHQRIVIFPIQRTEQTFRFQSLGVINCSLATFLSVWKNVIQCIFGNFILFKKIS